MPEFIEIELDNCSRKKIMYEINANGCWVCTSHSKACGDRTNSNCGYPRILYKGKTELISRVILFQKSGIQFSENCQVHHKCDTPSCINPDHIEVGTNTKNQIDAIRRNSNDKRTKINMSIARKIRELYYTGKFISQGEIASIYNIHHSQVSNIIRNKQWKEV